MADLAAHRDHWPDAPKSGAGRPLVFVVAAMLLAGAGFLLQQVELSMIFLTASVTLVCVACILFLRLRARDRAEADRLRFVGEFVEHDAVASFLTDDAGSVVQANGAGNRRFGPIEKGECALTTVLAAVLSDPGPLVLRLQARCKADGYAREDCVARVGHARLSVSRVGGGALLWRLEEYPDRKEKSEYADVGNLPMLTVGRSGTILFMNEPARQFIGGRAKTIDRLFVDLPPRSDEINQVTTSSGQRPCMVAEVSGTAGRIEYFLLPTPETVASVPALDVASFEGLPVPLLRVSPNGKVQDANREALRMLQIDNAQSLRLSDLMEGLGRPLTDWLKDAADGRDTGKTEFLRLKNVERETFVQVTLRRAGSGGETGVLVILSDATQLKTLEAQFVQSQKMQAIGQLAGGVAHDFNNLLTAISGHCDLLLLRHDQGDGDYADLVQINQNANRAAALVSQLLAFSRKQTLQPETLDLRDTLSDLTHLLNRLVGERVELVLSHDPLLQTVRADKRQLEQVMMNLVVNARDAMPEGGNISIKTENLTLKEPMNRDRVVVGAGDYVSVKVSDQGVGIPKDKLQKVFEPFWTTKRTGEGTGLGLSTVYGIIKQTGGFIFVDSVLGSGTCFTLLFPVHMERKRIATAAPVKIPESDSRSSRAEGVVLLVEDEAPVRAFASRALRLRGYTVLEADCAEDALEKLTDNALEIDVFVTDVVMPGMDGPSWVREALKQRPDTKVVFVSGYAEEAFGQDRDEIPNSVFLPKPFSLSDLTDTVQTQIAC